MELFLWDNKMTVKEVIEYIISKSKDDESLLTDTKRFWAYLSDLAPEHRKELKVIKRSLDSEFLTLCFKDKEDIKRRVFKMKFRLEEQGVGENWIDFIIESFFTPLGWKPPQDEEETSQTQKQQTQKQQIQKQQIQKQQTQNQQTQNQQTQKQQTQKQQIQKQQTQNQQIQKQQTQNQQTQNQQIQKQQTQNQQTQNQQIQNQQIQNQQTQKQQIQKQQIQKQQTQNQQTKVTGPITALFLGIGFFAFIIYEVYFDNSYSCMIFFLVPLLCIFSLVGYCVGYFFDNIFTKSSKKQQIQKQQTQNQQTQKQQNGGTWGYVAILIFVGIFILAIIFSNSKIIFSNSNKNDIKEPVTYSAIKTEKVGDYIKCGSYPQSENGDIQPIEWQILARKKNKIFVISRYGLDAKRFDSSSNFWANSEIRKWLNGDFYNNAFSEDEKKSISSLSSGDNVFLLSRNEAEKYFANDDSRRCKATDYAVKNGAWVSSSNGCSWWWLRSPNDISVYFVYSGGDIRCFSVISDFGVVRPALWININKEAVTYSTIETANVGDYIKFGNYPQTAEGEEQHIEWLVLSREKNKILVISRYGLDAKRFDSSSNVWANSEIRKWLNGDFYNNAFSEDEKKYISSLSSGDNVFLLSKNEAELYFANGEARRCKPTDYAVKNGAWVNKNNNRGNGYSVWWLRSPNFWNVFYVNSCGLISYYDVNCGNILARPALWINL